MKKYSLPDGLYRVTTRYLCAGFVIKNGYIIQCAPILKVKIDFWVKVAIKIEEKK